MDSVTLTTTRRSLHAVAELVLAGPQHRRDATIRLRVTPGGFATVTTPQVRVDGVDVVAGERRVPIDGNSCATLAAAIGDRPHALRGVYHDATDISPDQTLHIDAAAGAWLAGCWAAGDQALRRLAPDQTPVLWPEHFDVAIRLDDTNFGVSPGDTHLPEPYAYVGPPTPHHGPFWNQPFGAARPMRELDNADPTTVLAFFTEARALVATG